MPVSYQPTDGLSYDPEEARYWDAAGLQKEVTRTFEVCHGCRMCFKYCDSFPILFDLIDKKHEGDVRSSPPPRRPVIDACFQQLPLRLIRDLSRTVHAPRHGASRRSAA